MSYFEQFPHVIDNWIKLAVGIVLMLLLPGWWALIGLAFVLSMRA